VGRGTPEYCGWRKELGGRGPGRLFATTIPCNKHVGPANVCVVLVLMVMLMMRRTWDCDDGREDDEGWRATYPTVVCAFASMNWRGLGAATFLMPVVETGGLHYCLRSFPAGVISSSLVCRVSSGHDLGYLDVP